MKPLALLFVYVWPEPRSSAAGVRTLALLKDLLSLGYEVMALSPSKESAHSERLQAEGIRIQVCPANDSDAAEKLKGLEPSLVMFDRFVMEEQFGWRARELWPGALQIVDTQDLHSVRRARERLLKEGRSALEIESLKGATFPDLERELASLYRADAALVVSPWEKEWLVSQGYPPDRVHCLPFPAEAETSTPAFEERQGFAFLGNFRHPPNLDAVNWLREEVWPLVRQRLPGARLHLYGAYPPASVSSLHGKNGILAEGPVEDHRKALARHRVLLAPLRFGAGIKGKVLEAWASGTVVAGTPIALEGLQGAGFSDPDALAAEAVRWHESRELWLEQQSQSLEALRPFSPGLLRASLQEFLALAREKLPVWRAALTGRMLRHHGQNATKYFSLWIEAKNKK